MVAIHSDEGYMFAVHLIFILVNRITGTKIRQCIKITVLIRHAGEKFQIRIGG